MRILLLLAILSSGSRAISQNTIGIPDITNYTKSIYNAGTQNRCIAQDRNGIMYFANYEGLLTFDGTYWKIYPLPHKTVIRSLAIGSDDKIYVGSQDDFGYFAPQKNGKLIYTSLRSLLSETAAGTLSEIWETVAYNNDIFFRSRELIFQLSNNIINVFPAKSQWQFMGISNNQLIAQDLTLGLLEFKNGLWNPIIEKKELPGGFTVSCVFPFGKDSTFIATINSGFFILSRNKISRFEFKNVNPFLNQRILTATPISNDWLAVGTNLKGCYIINKRGEIIQNLSRKEGLQINNILYLFVDSHKNLWLGLDDGIDFIAINNEIKHIYPENLNEGVGYTALIFQNSLYIGTSNGLYKVPLNGKKDLSLINGNFESVPGTVGSSWGLSEINGKLLFGHHDGLFQIDNGRAILVSNTAAFFNFLPYYNILPSSLIIAGTSIGINMLKYENDHFISKGYIPGFNEFSQFIAIDNHNIIWVAHPYRGVFKIDIGDVNNPKSKIYNYENGLPSSYNNHLFKIKNRVVVATEKGIYEYNGAKDRFEFSEYFKVIFGEKNIRHLKEDSSGNIWFIENKNLGVVDFSSGKPEITNFPELDGKMVADYEYVYPFNKMNVFVGAEKGFYHINYDNYKKKSTNNLQLRVTTVKAFGKSDTLLFGGYFGQVNETVIQSKKSIPEVSSNYNSLHFEFSSPLYEQQNSIVYSYFLQGFDDKWSSWAKKSEKDYTNLPGGKYTFMVKAKNNLGSESVISSYVVNVLSPWYKTVTAFIVYGIFFIVFNFLFFKKLKQLFVRQREKHEARQKHLQYVYQLEFERSEKEIGALKNEKLQAEIRAKNAELASTTMHLLQKRDLISKVKEGLTHIKKQGGVEPVPQNYKKLIKVLNEEEHVEDEWQIFATHFDTVHLDFLRLIKKSHPNLTPHELKLCAYLHMNLCSKQIAQHMKISVRGVEIGRYRLRKKLQVPREANLFEFLLYFSSSNHHQQEIN
jgi:ligand-binding sensor domain-containing protein/DNA-binding CsgD family transcriptional regulator